LAIELNHMKAGRRSLRLNWAQANVRSFGIQIVEKVKKIYLYRAVWDPMIGQSWRLYRSAYMGSSFVRQLQPLTG